MTIIVGIKCKEGVVIGADSSATFGAGPHLRTIEQLTDHKIQIIKDRVIVAGTGYVGHQQRFSDVVEKIYARNDTFGKRSTLDVARALAQDATKDWAQTNAPRGQYAALVAYEASDDNFALCEYSVDAFQPEVKQATGLWFAAMGSGQPIVDPFLALLKKVFWSSGPPGLRGGIFSAYWALQQACELNTGGIQPPIHIAVLSRDPAQKGRIVASKLGDEQLAEHRDMVAAATAHVASFRDVLEGTKEVEAVPKPEAVPPKAPAPLPGLPGGARMLPRG
jgi:ATP-dependent protease HslVU (ClpYQ) peptidase subunit